MLCSLRQRKSRRDQSWRGHYHVMLQKSRNTPRVIPSDEMLLTRAGRFALQPCFVITISVDPTMNRLVPQQGGARCDDTGWRVYARAQIQNRSIGEFYVRTL